MLRESPLPFDESAGFTAPPTFGPYRVLHQIGSGVLGPVFRTYDPQHDRLVAVKAFRLEIVPELVARLAESLRRLASSGLAHPGIVSPLDAGLEGTTAFLAMDYVAAETLDVALRHLAPMPLDRALPLLSQAASAIEAAWAAGFGHGALHPRDVFVALDGDEVRISGFGVLPAIEALGIKSPVRRPYSAPERLQGGEWDERADVYSLGSIAHELLTRRRPAGPGEQDGALTAGTTPEQRVLIRRVLSAALAERPEHRFATAKIFVDALGAILRGEAVTSLPEAEVTEPERETDKSRNRSKRTQETAPLFADIEEPVVRAPVEPQPEPAAPSMLTAVEEFRPEPIVKAEPPPEPRPPTPEPVPAPPPRPDAWRPGVTFGAPVETHANPFPWSAVVAVAVASVVLGLAIGYQVGLRRAPAAPPPIVETAPLRPADTEVPVQPESGRAPERAPAAAKPPAGPRATPAKPPPAAARSSAPAGRRPSPAKPSPATGSIFVDSRPREARVIIDGRFVGVTPLRLGQLSNGAHTVRLELAGHLPFTTRTAVKPGEQTRVTAALEQKR